jgi:hypothetical protein
MNSTKLSSKIVYSLNLKIKCKLMRKFCNPKSNPILRFSPMLSEGLLAKISDQRCLFIHFALLCIISWVADKLIQWEVESHSYQRIWLIVGIDSCCHGVLSAVLWSSIEQKYFLKSSFSSRTFLDWAMWKNILFQDNLQSTRNIFFAIPLGMILDSDHFLAALSWRLYDARHLSSRPFGHSILFIVMFPILIYLFTKNSNLSVYIFTCFFCHQLRDSQKRGLRFWPIGSTPPIPRIMVYLCFILLSLGIRHFYVRKKREVLATEITFSHV